MEDSGNQQSSRSSLNNIELQLQASNSREFEEKVLSLSTPRREELMEHEQKYQSYTPVDLEENLATQEPLPNPSESSSKNYFRNMERHFVIIGGVVLIVVGLLVVLLPISFSSMEYYEMGFKKSKTTGNVDTDTVYSGGRHLVGPDATFKAFKADAHFIYFDKVNMFASDRLQVQISARFQYFLRKHQLNYLHENFDLRYQPILSNNALDALKGAATLFSTREYIRERNKIQEALFKAVRERLGGSCCEKDCKSQRECDISKNCKPYDICVPGCKQYSQCREADMGLFAQVRYFQLDRLDIPDSLNERYLQALVLQEQTEAEKFKQNAQIERKETQGMVREIENQATEISQNATAQASLIGSRASADATVTVEKARSDGLVHVFSTLGITDQQHKASFDYFRTLKSKKNIKLAVNYQQLISMQSPVQQ